MPTKHLLEHILLSLIFLLNHELKFADQQSLSTHSVNTHYQPYNIINLILFGDKQTVCHFSRYLT